MWEPIGYNASFPKRKPYNGEFPHLKNRAISNEKPNDRFQNTRKTRIIPKQSQHEEGNFKDQNINQ